MTIGKFLVLAATFLALPAAARAQDAEVTFWLKGASGNIQGCIAADPTFTREQTFKLVNGQAEVRMAGGIYIKLKPVRPNVYAGDFDLGRMNLHMVADLAATPKSLTVTNQNLGCKWSAIKE